MTGGVISLTGFLNSASTLTKFGNVVVHFAAPSHQQYWDLYICWLATCSILRQGVLQQMYNYSTLISFKDRQAPVSIAPIICLRNVALNELLQYRSRAETLQDRKYRPTFSTPKLRGRLDASLCRAIIGLEKVLRDNFHLVCFVHHSGNGARSKPRSAPRTRSIAAPAYMTCLLR